MSQNKTVRFVVSLMLSLTGCSKASFKAYDGSSVERRWITGDSKFYSIKQTISSTQVRPLDIIWVVDNSGSMSTEAAHVRTNLASFVQQLSSVSDVKIALISQLGQTGTATRLPVTNIPSLEINQPIDSINALVAVASTLCPVNSSNPECVGLGSKYQAIRGQLNGFLRNNSQKILVVVTDDEASISETEFKAVYDSLYPSQSLSVFGWVGLGPGLSSCQANTGAIYTRLSALTGGEVYNVCDSDWSSHFSRLATNVVTLAQDTVTLPQDVLAGQFQSVTVNGSKIGTTEYAKTATGIRLSASVRQGITVVDLTIEYK